MNVSGMNSTFPVQVLCWERENGRRPCQYLGFSFLRSPSLVDGGLRMSHEEIKGVSKDYQRAQRIAQTLKEMVFINKTLRHIDSSNLSKSMTSSPKKLPLSLSNGAQSQKCLTFR